MHFRLISFFISICFASSVFSHGDVIKHDEVFTKRCAGEIESSPHCGTTPTSVLDDDGVMHFVYVANKHIKFVSSNDNGQSFSQAVNVNTISEAISADGENRPKIAIGKNKEIYVSWVHKTKGRYTGDIRFSRSVDKGKTFSTPVTINDDEFLTSHRYDSLIVKENGDVYLVWLDKRDLMQAKEQGEGYKGSALYYTLSKDSGKTFMPNKKIADYSCECCRVITQENSRNELVVLWRHIFAENIRDHAITILDPDKDKDSNITRVTFDDWSIDACPHHGPHMAIDTEDKLHLSWFTGKEGKGGLHYGQYDKHTKSIINPLHFDTSPTASRPQIISHSDELFILWKTVVNKTTYLQMISSNNKGLSWSEPVSIADSNSRSDHPQVFANKNNAFVSWWSMDKGLEIIPLRKKQDISLTAFSSGSFEAIKAKYDKKDFLLVLWSLDCPPCFKEMELLKEYRKNNPLPELVLISTDGEEDLPTLSKALNEFSMHTADNWYFNDLPEQLRVEIDSTWYGELPRSYYFSQDGNVKTHRGVLTAAVLDKWFKEKTLVNID